MDALSQKKHDLNHLPHCFSSCCFDGISDIFEEFKKGGCMNRVITVVFFVIFGLFLMSDLAHANGATTYAVKCKACHGPEGKGNAVLKAPAFDASKPDADLIKIVTLGKGKMPQYGGKLSDAEIMDVVKFVKTFK